MVALLLLSHGILAVLALLSAGAEREGRTRFLRGLAVTGAAFGVLMMFATPLFPDDWRTIAVVSSSARIVGVAITAAWILAAVAEAGEEQGRWDTMALTGVASSSLALFGLSQWSVPALVFAGIASLCIYLIAEGRGLARAALVLGITSLTGSLVWHVAESSLWRLPSAAPAPQLWVAVGSGIALALAVVLLVPARGAVLPATPLVLGLSFSVFESVARGTGPVVGLVLIALGLLTVVRLMLVKDPSQRLVLIWVLTVTLGLAALSSNPYATARAGIAGVLGVSALVLWPLSLGRAQIERGVLIAFVALTAGFNAIAAAASFAFDRGTGIEDVLDAAPWAAVAAILPVALAGGVALGASVGRSAEPEEFHPAAVIATWSLVVLSLAVGVFPFVDTARGDSTTGVVLYVVAVVAGVAAARYARGIGGATAPGTPALFAGPRPVDRWPRPVALASLVIGLLAAVVMLGLTFQGLRVGFL